MSTIFSLGNKYKKYFTVSTITSSNSTLKGVIVCDKDKQCHINVYDGYLTNKFSDELNFITINVEQNQNNKFSICGDNYEINELYFSNNNIQCVILQQLKHLKSLNVSVNPIKYLVVEKNLQLQNLIAYNTNIEKINLSKNYNLKTLDLSNNYLTNIDLSKNYNLQQVSLQNNFLTTFTYNDNLIKLNLSKNNLISFYVSSNSSLQYINLSYNKLVSFNFTNNLFYQIVNLSNNPIETVKLSGNNWHKLCFYDDLLLCYNQNNLLVTKFVIKNTDIGQFDLTDSVFTLQLYNYTNIQRKIILKQSHNVVTYNQNIQIVRI